MLEKMDRIESPVSAEIVINGRKYINFGGSSYLGLSHIEETLDTGVEALRKWGTGASIPTNHGIVTPALRDIEVEAAHYFGFEEAMFLGSGYLFGIVGARALADSFDTIFYDQLSHFALCDGIAASGLKARAFRHLDSDDLERQLKLHLSAGCRPVVASDSMFSTFGDIAPLDQYAAAVRPYGGRLLVDESHGFGVLGTTGRGGWEHHALKPSEVLFGGSLGKAFGVCGGIIVGDQEDITRCRATSAGRGANPGLAAAAAMAAANLRLVQARPELLAKLRRNTSYAKARLRGIGLDVGKSVAPVASFTLPSAAAMRRLKSRLLDDGIFVYRTTYIGSRADGVIRCAIFADHEEVHFDALADALSRHL